VRAFVDWAGLVDQKTARAISVQSICPEMPCAYQIQNSLDDGFIRLYTVAGHRYWVAQAEHGHSTPDWKLHFSILPGDLAVAWNAIAELFIRSRCSAAMKLINGRKPPPSFMAGRELTIYIYRHDRRYINCRFGGGRSEEPLERCLDACLEQSASFWLGFIDVAESTLARLGVQPGALANGDRRVGRYSSLRNEAFVRIPARIQRQLDSSERAFYATFRSGTRDGSTYPPNALGYNARKHPDPFGDNSAGSWLGAGRSTHVLALVALVFALTAAAWSTQHR